MDVDTWENSCPKLFPTNTDRFFGHRVSECEVCARLQSGRSGGHTGTLYRLFHGHIPRAHSTGCSTGTFHGHPPRAARGGLFHGHIPRAHSTDCSTGTFHGQFHGQHGFQGQTPRAARAARAVPVEVARGTCESGHLQGRITLPSGGNASAAATGRDLAATWLLQSPGTGIEQSK
eukprot:gene328-biopygen12106